MGTSSPVVPQVLTTSFGAAEAALAHDGTLAYVAAGAGSGIARTLVWVDRQGHETPIAVPPRVYSSPRISPDGTRVAVTATVDQDVDIWLGDLIRATLTRVTSGGINVVPLWMPDGRRVVFSSSQAGVLNLFAQAADGTGTVDRLTESPNAQRASAVTPDGTVVFTEESSKTGADVMALTLDGPRRVRPLVQTPKNERSGIVSPDGRWLAYEADDSGSIEIYVRPFPEVNSGRWLVSTSGGTSPLWARSGQELFYMAPDTTLMRVQVASGPPPLGTPEELFQVCNSRADNAFCSIPTFNQIFGPNGGQGTPDTWAGTVDWTAAAPFLQISGVNNTSTPPAIVLGDVRVDSLVTAEKVPEPGSMALIATGLVGLVFARYRKVF